jgi:hypothetical protein
MKVSLFVIYMYIKLLSGVRLRYAQLDVTYYTLEIPAGHWQRKQPLLL